MSEHNPKHIQQLKEGKAPMEYVPYAPLAAIARVMETGAKKYGVRNWRADKILASTYVGAIARHALLEWAQGEDVDKDSGESPLAHVAACCLLVMDSEMQGTLIDDRTICASGAADQNRAPSAPEKAPEPDEDGWIENTQKVDPGLKAETFYVRYPDGTEMLSFLDSYQWCWDINIGITHYRVID